MEEICRPVPIRCLILGVLPRNARKNEVEGIAAAEGQGQDAVENKQGAALRHGEKYDACYEVEQQIYRIKYGLHNIGHFGLIGFVIHVFILSV